MRLTVDIGLLWEEAVIRGELRGRFHVRCRTDCCRFLTFEAQAGEFAAQARAAPVAERWGVRLAESLTPEHAERMQEALHAARPDLEADILEAGRNWEGLGFDNRVWWPCVRAGCRTEAEFLLEELRRAETQCTTPVLDPLALATVRVDPAVSTELFDFAFADSAARVLEVRAVPLDRESTFVLRDVPVGRGFHWQHKENLAYRGILVLRHTGRGLTAVNSLPLETYLESAVGSEMRDDLPPAFSETQAICARSTVLATANRHHRADGFDLCNDDHCQCYQGIAREAQAITEPIRRTAGVVLTHKRRIVDARYAKSCGGVSERYESVWGAEGPEYFAVRACGEFAVPDLAHDDAARAFLENAPPAWCNPAHHSYPEPWNREPLFRWRFRYTRKRLGELIADKTGRDVGEIRSLRAVRRGASGRILILEVEGRARGTRLYGELAIRRALSESHLPSSFFVFEEHGDEIVLAGGGWGHGVGLCQLGACAMARAGADPSRILAHYYPRTKLGPLDSAADATQVVLA